MFELEKSYKQNMAPVLSNANMVGKADLAIGFLSYDTEKKNRCLKLCKQGCLHFPQFKGSDHLFYGG